MAAKWIVLQTAASSISQFGGCEMNFQGLAFSISGTNARWNREIGNEMGK